MKTIFGTIIAVSSAILMSMTLFAQPSGKKISREELAVKQAEHISTELAFDDATSKKFKETYCIPEGTLGIGAEPRKAAVRQSGRGGDEAAFRPQSEDSGSPQEVLRHLQHFPLTEADFLGVRD